MTYTLARIGRALRLPSSIMPSTNVLGGAVLLLAALSLAPRPAGAATFHVDMANPSCSNSGDGSETQPYCTITAAVNARAAAGNTILVHPGTYREQVTVPASGTAAQPIVIRATGPGVHVEGASDLSQPSSWALHSGTVWRASAVTTSPRQVLVDHDRLAVSSAAPASLPSGAYRYVSGQGLYVNLGGDNPGAHEIHVGARNYGFRLDRRSHVMVEGFSVRYCDDRGIYLTGPLVGTIVQNNTATFCLKNGIAAISCTSIVIRDNVASDHADHGIYLSGVHTSVIEGNEAMRNARPATRAANGIYVYGSDNNVIRSNRLHHNQDTGLNFTSGADFNLCTNNLLYMNGDHGTDHTSCNGNVHIGDVAVRNYKDGFSVEGSSPNHKVFNCIGVDNGIGVVGASLEFNLWVDGSSSAGFQSDYNIWWNSTPAEPIKYVSTKYATISAFAAATGKDAHSIQADPMFRDTLDGDFHLRDGSPAIDAAISSIANWPDRDFGGAPRVDDPATPNTGAGPVVHADRGAFEFSPNVSPLAILTVDPISGIGPLPVVASGASSTDPDGTIASYTFDFGDGAVVGPQPSPTASHTYAVGEYALLLTVLDSRGGTDTSAVPVVVSSNLVANPSFEAGTAGWTSGGGTLTRVPGGFDGGFSAQIQGPANTSTFTLNDSPDVVAATSAVNTRYRFTAWVRSLTHGGGARLRVREYNGGILQRTSETARITLTPDWQLLSVDHLSALAGSNLDLNLVESPDAPSESFEVDQITARVVTLDRAPVVSAAAADTTPERAAVSIDVVASDPDGEVFALSADLGGLPPGNDAQFVIGPDNSTGTLTWTPTYQDARAEPYAVTFLAANTLTGTTTSEIHVTEVDPAPMVTAPESLGVSEAQRLDVPVTAVDPDGSPIATLTADLSRLPAGHDAVFTPDAGNASGALTWTPSHLDAPGVFPVFFTAGNGSSGADTTWIRVLDANAPPTIDAPATFVAGEATVSSFVARITDLDGESIDVLDADFSGFPPGHGATFTSSPDRSSGTFEWAPPAGTASGPYPLVITASNNLTRSDTVLVSVDRQPVVTAPASAEGGEGRPLTIAVAAVDPDGGAIDSLTADLSSLPAGSDAVFTVLPDQSSGTLLWTPGDADGRAAPYPVTFRAYHGLVGASVTTIVVDQPPTLTVPSDLVVTEGDELVIDVDAVDPDGDAVDSLTTDISGIPSGAGAVFDVAPDNASGILRWTPSPGDGRLEPYTVEFRAANALSAVGTTRVTVDRAPIVAAPAAASGTEAVELVVTVTADDPDGEPIASLGADLSGLPAGNDATFTVSTDGRSGTLRWTPSHADSGTHAVVFTAANPRALGSATTVLHVDNVDRAPVVSAPPTFLVGEGDSLVIEIAAVDPDGDPIAALEIDLSDLPANHGAEWTSAAGNSAGRLVWVPTSEDGGPAPYAIGFTASNLLQGSAQALISVDQYPVMTRPASVEATESEAISIPIAVTDPDGDPIATLAADLSSLPEGNDAVFTPAAGNAAGTLTWTPDFFSAPGPYPIVFTASNALVRPETTLVHVTNVDRAPVLQCPAVVVVGEGDRLSLEITVADPDLEPITSIFADLVGLPSASDATFTPNPDQTGGVLTWTPRAGDGDASPYVVTFMGGNALVTANATAIIVDRSPRLTAPDSVSIEETATLQVPVTAADPDGTPLDSLVVDLSDLPAGHDAAFSADPSHTSGNLTWTPTYDDARAEPYAVRFRAVNALASSWTTLVTVTSRDRAPSVTLPPDLLGAESAALTLNVEVSDPEGDPIDGLHADLSGLPAVNNAVFTVEPDHRSGVLTWTPRPEDAPGPYEIRFIAENSLADTESVVIRIDRRARIDVAAEILGVEGLPISVAIAAEDPDGGPIESLVADLSGLPGGNDAVFTPAADHRSGVLTWTPTYVDSGGPYVVTLTAANALVTSASTHILVANTDRAPILTAAVADTAPPHVPLAIPVTVTDPDGDPIASLAADLSGLPSGHGAVFDVAPDRRSGTLHWTPASGDARLDPYAVAFIASNALADTQVTTIKIDQRPIVTLVPASLTIGEGNLVTLDVTAVDPDGQAIETMTANLSGLPAGSDAIFAVASEGNRATLIWTPTFDDSRETPYAVTFLASNDLIGTAACLIRVENTDRAPVVTAPAAGDGVGGSPIVVQVTAADPDGDPITSLSADLAGLPALHDAQFTSSPDGSSGTLTWTPTTTDPRGPYSASFFAANALTGSATTLLAVDQAPVVTAPDTVRAAEGTAIMVDIAIADPNGDPIDGLTADLSGLPAPNDAQFVAAPDRTTGRLTWTPGYHDAGGPYRVTFAASNALSTSAAVEIVVSDTDRAPIAAAPAVANATENSEVEVVVGVADPDGDPIASLTADLSRLPASSGAHFTSAPDASSGTLAWTPGFDDSGGPYEVTFIAANALADTATTAILVANSDRAPVVTAPLAVSADEGQRVDIEVQALDPDGEPILFLTADLAALPAGNDAVFTIAPGGDRGTLTWTPGFGDGRDAAFNVTFTAFNGLAATFSTAISVADVNRDPAISAPDTAIVAEGAPLTLALSAVDPDGEVVTSFTADFAGLPAGHSATFVTGADPATATFDWTPGFHDAGGPYPVTFSAQSSGPGSHTTLIFVTNMDRAPVVATPASVAVVEGSAVAVSVTATDPDGDPIAAFSADLSALPFVNDAVFTVAPDGFSGTLSWTPRAEDVRAAPYDIVFRATNTLEGSATTSIQVSPSNLAPTARLSATPTAGTPPLSVAFDAAGSTDPDGAIATYAFDFGDGATQGPQASPAASHTYGRGFWTARVIVTDDDGGRDTASVIVDATQTNLVANPGFETDLSGWTRYGSATLTRVAGGHSGGFCARVAGSSSSSFGIDDLPNTIPAVAAVGLTYRFSAWIRSDNSTRAVRLRIYEIVNGSQVGSTFYSPEVRLSPEWQLVTVDFVTRRAGAALSMRITNYPSASGEVFFIDDLSIEPPVTAQPPVAALSLSPSSGDAPLAVVADASGSFDTDGTITSYRFDFGDGTVVGPQPTPVASHVYSNPGAFTARVVVFDDDGARDSAQVAVTVAPDPNNQPPIAVLDVSPASGMAPLAVTADAAGSTDPDGAIATYEFDFGDGATQGPQASPAASHTYSSAGEYTARVIVTDTGGARDTAEITVTVDPAPGGGNLIANSGFETDLSGWTRYGSATLTRVAGGHSGAFCARVAGSSSSSFGIDDLPNTIPAVAAVGLTYRFSAWIRSDNSTRAVKLRIYEIVNGSQVGSTFYSPEVRLSPEWQLVTVDFVTRRAGAALSMRITNYPSASGEVFFIDDLSIERIAPAALMARAHERADRDTSAGSSAGTGASHRFEASFGPNPMRSHATLRFATSVGGPVRVDIHDLTGRRVRTLVNERHARPGTFAIPFRGRGQRGLPLPAGTYFFRIRAAEGLLRGRIVIAR